MMDIKEVPDSVFWDESIRRARESRKTVLINTASEAIRKLQKYVEEVTKASDGEKVRAPILHQMFFNNRV